MLYIKLKNTIKKNVPRAVWALSFLVVSLFITSCTEASDVTPGALMRLTNQVRKEAGLAELKQNDLLNQAAEAKAKDMFKNDYFAHTSPKGVTPWYWIKQSGYAYGYAGENLAINYDTAESEHKAWMKSPTHRANILNKNYQEIGIAVVEGKIDDKNARVTVQIFATPKVVPATSLAPREYLPNTKQLVAEVKGVEVELSQTVLPPEMKQPFAQQQVPTSVSEQSIPPEKFPFKQESPFDLYIYLTLIVLQLVVFMATAPFLYLAGREFYGFRLTVECRAWKEAVHAFELHHPKAL